MAKSFNRDSLKHLKAKPLLFVADRINAPQDEIYSKYFLQIFNSAEAKFIPKSYHMSFLQSCKPDFPSDDPELRELCVENSQKLLIQKEVANQSIAMFRSAL
jgi:hypothetical protein